MSTRHGVFVLLLMLMVGQIFLLVRAWNRNGRSVTLHSKSGLQTWVDPDTPVDHYLYVSSRGDEWHLAMSDEFNTPDRTFEPGEDHLWTSLEKPDGVNTALEVYAHNMTTTKCDNDGGLCYLQIEVVDAITTISVWNSYQLPPGPKNVTFFYRGGMIQSWNKFCFQGGMIEVRARMPGAVSANSMNPDLASGFSGRAATIAYYPTWPGIWMMGNLGRAIFSGSTNRMWPFSYNECAPEAFEPSNQRINACDGNPGSAMNAFQGRGAPEIDLLEGGGTDISSSIQVGPGMPRDFRIIPPVNERLDCVYTSSCATIGANTPDIPRYVYEDKRNHRSWYQKLRYAANNFCQANPSLQQSYSIVKNALDNGIEDNVCRINTCPASKDPNADLDRIDQTTKHWGINSKGTCFPVLNAYMGSFLCSPGNPSTQCTVPSDEASRNSSEPEFAYQMDAISSSWPVHMAAYIDYLTYQLEWVPGANGYVRWMLGGEPIFEIPAQALTDPPQDTRQRNPRKLMIEEPLYMIFNIAMSAAWGAQPPNPGQPCRGDGTDPQVNRICDDFPMFMKIDYVRVYQDNSSTSKMQVGCDPPSHPTRQWILDHLNEYEDSQNTAMDVHGRGFCRTHDDCTIQSNTGSKYSMITGRCVNRRCECLHSSWTGPRCTTTMYPVMINENMLTLYGPSLSLVLGTIAIMLVVHLVLLRYFLWVKEMEEKHKHVTMTNTKKGKPIDAEEEHCVT